VVPTPEARRQRRREHRLQRVPVFLVEYPLESIMAAWGSLNGLQLVLGLGELASIRSVLDYPWSVIWCAAMALAGLTIVVGMAKHRYGTIVPTGMQLLAMVVAVYGCGIIDASGWRRGASAATLMFSIALLCWLRAWWLRGRERVIRSMRSAAKR
jgi:hypothetical protein